MISMEDISYNWIIILEKMFDKLDGHFRHLTIDTNQYIHSWTIVSRKGERECLGYWIENQSKIPDCNYLVELFKRFIILKLIKIQSLIRMHLIKKRLHFRS